MLNCLYGYLREGNAKYRNKKKGTNKVTLWDIKVTFRSKFGGNEAE